MGISDAHMRCKIPLGYNNYVEGCKHEHPPMSSPRSLDKYVEPVYSVHYYYFCIKPREDDEDFLVCTDIDEVSFTTTVSKMIPNIQKIFDTRCGDWKYTYHQEKLEMRRRYARMCSDAPWWYYME